MRNFPTLLKFSITKERLRWILMLQGCFSTYSGKINELSSRHSVEKTGSAVVSRLCTSQFLPQFSRKTDYWMVLPCFVLYIPWKSNDMVTNWQLLLYISHMSHRRLDMDSTAVGVIRFVSYQVTVASPVLPNKTNFHMKFCWNLGIETHKLQ